MNFLACDLGGTKVLLGIFERVKNDSPKLLFKKKYISSEWDSFELILEDFLKNECKNITHPSSACFAVAGPLSNNNAKIINLSWNLSLIHISEPTRHRGISYAVFCLFRCSWSFI